MPSRGAHRSARDVARAELTRAILDSARQQLAEVGPAALSVRAVARDLGMASSAVYRYFPSRDAMLTSLLVQAYDDLGEAVERADGGVRNRDDLLNRWRRACHAVRDWALAQPHEYALLYGSPVPGYAAPEDTIPAAIRVPVVLLAITAEAHQRGVALTTAPMPVSRKEHRALRGVRDIAGATIDDARLVRSLMAWENLFGHVSLELFGHMYRGILDYDAHFQHVVDRLGRDLGLG